MALLSEAERLAQNQQQLWQRQQDREAARVGTRLQGTYIAPEQMGGQSYTNQPLIYAISDGGQYQNTVTPVDQFFPMSTPTNAGGGLLNSPGGLPMGAGTPSGTPAGTPTGTPAGSTGAGAGGTSGGLYQGVNVNQYQQNPYLSQMGDVLTSRVTDNLNRQIMPGIRSNAIAAGGFGGSRQGVVEANALKDANQTISDALTGAYFQDFTNQMNRNLQQYGQNQNFYTNQRGQDLSQAALGASLYQQGNTGFLGQGQGIYGLGTTQQQAPWQTINNANAGLGQWSGYGTTTSANTGGGAQGVAGGALAGAQLGGLWGSPNASNNWTGIPYNANTTIPMQPGGGY